ncbi:hypothetical protein KJ812_02845 [Patescibacteria group bacterium]|nr:hypothetical protein [Patescibacteria group bacterium]
MNGYGIKRKKTAMPKQACCCLPDIPDAIENAIYRGPAEGYYEFQNPKFQEMAGKKGILPETIILIWEIDNTFVIMKRSEIM